MFVHVRDEPPPRRWRNAVLTVGAVIGGLCILATVASVLFGLTP